MSLKSTLEYLWYGFKNPHYKDFISEGFGIVAREKRCKKQWAQHLLCTKEFVRNCLPNGDRIIILGAGRLLDVDLPYLSNNFNEVTLVDADPVALKYWQKAKNHLPNKSSIKFKIFDVTGVVLLWTKLLLEHVSTQTLNNQKLADIFDTLPRPLAPIIPEIDKSAVVSLNLLGQIPIYWRERALALIRQHTKIEINENDELAAGPQEALNRSQMFLQEQHLQMLENSGAAAIVIVYDDEYYYYSTSQQHWQVEKALYFKRELKLKGYKTDLSDSWLWHIAPQGIEYKEFGVIHRVQAQSFSKS